MAGPADFEQRLSECLEREINQSRRLLALLLHEQEVVAGSDESGIQASAGSKEALVDSLQHATAARLALLEAHGFGRDAEAVRRCLASLADPALTRRFDELSTLGHRCIRENRQVGKLINRRLLFIGKALGSLTHHAEAPATYEASGKAGSTGSRRTFGNV